MARVSSRSTSAACFSTLPGGARPHPPMATRARDAARAATHSRHPSPPTPRACPCRRPASPPNASTPSRQPSDRRAAPAPIAQCARHHQGRGHLGRPEGGLRQCGHRRVRRAVKGLPDRRVVAQGRGRRRQHLTAPQRVEWPTSRDTASPRLPTSASASAAPASAAPANPRRVHVHTRTRTHPRAPSQFPTARAPAQPRYQNFGEGVGELGNLVPAVGKVTIAMLERNLLRLHANFHEPSTRGRALVRGALLAAAAGAVGVALLAARARRSR